MEHHDEAADGEFGDKPAGEPGGSSQQLPPDPNDAEESAPDAGSKSFDVGTVASIGSAPLGDIKEKSADLKARTINRARMFLKRQQTA